LLAEMLLFFVPLCVEIAGYMEVFAREGARLAGAVLLGTVMVMAGVAVVVDVVYRWETGWNAAREQGRNAHDQ
jgi:holin-like protein